MEINTVNVNHLDVDAHALLPPRKRLLAGLKRQNSDVNNSSSTMCEYDTRVNNRLRSHLSSASHLSEDIVEASRLAAMEATKVAEAARVTAEEKAAKAVKAVAAAKSALELVDILSVEASSKEKYPKKNKTKKHDPIPTIYSKHKGVRNSKTVEELARKSHLANNSSTRISKKSSSSDLKNSKCKRVKRLTTKVHNGGSVLDGNRPSMSNGIATVPGGNLIAVDLNSSKPNKLDQMKVETGEGSQSNKIDRLKLENGEAKILRSKEKFVESLDDLCSYSKTRGKFKRKMLPLSICSSRDQ